MKKHILILAGSALILASCGSNNNENQQSEQAKMDSIAKANAALQDELNQKKNDSTINPMAAAKADSMAKEAEDKKSTKKTKTTKVTTTTTTTTAPNIPGKTNVAVKPKTGQDAKFDKRTGVNPDQPKITPEQQKAQDDKFNRRK